MLLRIWSPKPTGCNLSLKVLDDAIEVLEV